MNKHQLTYIDMHPQPVKQPRNEWLYALLFAVCIGAPFALYFAFFMQP